MHLSEAVKIFDRQKKFQKETMMKTIEINLNQINAFYIKTSEPVETETIVPIEQQKGFYSPGSHTQYYGHCHWRQRSTIKCLWHSPAKNWEY